jgi:hypothetical protein
MNGEYYTPKEFECRVNIMIKDMDCKSRTSDQNQWCENCKKKYLVVDIASGSIGFLLSKPSSFADIYSQINIKK